MMPLFRKILNDCLLKRWIGRFMLTLWLSFGLPLAHETARADNTLEYQVKAAFIYNFIAFTQWPDNSDATINLCLYGEDYFGQEIDKLQSRTVGTRPIKVSRISNPQQLVQCQAVFFSKSVNDNLAELIPELADKPILTLADSSNAASRGVAINMSLINEKVIFEINLGVARKAGLDISSKLLQLAIKVYQ
ncbi:YfiR family protein [Nitrosomonas sp.]|uniref:YfiR family protein n=1 Tax=Nitrosomonas sp. TaxID=42353 RepID=UPI0025E28C80|nr:YfiR family protein [Nitrosomonas sp.]